MEDRWEMEGSAYLYTSTSRIKMFIVYRADEESEDADFSPKYKKQELIFLTAQMIKCTMTGYSIL